MIDLTITWCKVNATKKIREFCLMGTISSEQKLYRSSLAGKNFLRLSFAVSHTPKAPPTAGKKKATGSTDFNQSHGGRSARLEAAGTITIARR
jgi:hypothetical protein